MSVYEETDVNEGGEAFDSMFVGNIPIFGMSESLNAYFLQRVLILTLVVQRPKVGSDIRLRHAPVSELPAVTIDLLNPPGSHRSNGLKDYERSANIQSKELLQIPVSLYL